MQGDEQYPAPEGGKKVRFGDLPIGTRLFFFGKRFRKTALSMCEDDDRNGHVFREEYLVEVQSEPEVGGNPS